MTQHDDEPRAELLRGELDAADLRRRDDVTGDANDKQVSQTLVEHDFGGNPGIGAPKHDGKRRLFVDQLFAPGWPQAAVPTGFTGDEPQVAGP